MHFIIAAYLFQNEGLIAVLVGIFGPAATLVVARWIAKKQLQREPIDDAFRFRGELSKDNETLRVEIRDLKLEILGYKGTVKELERELRKFYQAQQLQKAVLEHIEKTDLIVKDT